jgi:hypothetical protein
MQENTWLGEYPLEDIEFLLAEIDRLEDRSPYCPDCGVTGEWESLSMDSTSSDRFETNV